jgi:hypothetical protein
VYLVLGKCKFLVVLEHGMYRPVLREFAQDVGVVVAQTFPLPMAVVVVVLQLKQSMI